MSLNEQSAIEIRRRLADASLLARSGLPHQAIQRLEGVIAEFGPVRDALILMVSTARQSGELAKVAQALDHLILHEPNQPAFLVMRCSVALDHDEDPGVVEPLAERLDHYLQHADSPAFASIVTGARLYERCGRWDDAARLYKEAGRDTRYALPDRKSALVDAGQLYETGGDLSQAAQCYETAKSLLPDDPEIDIRLAHLDGLDGNLDVGLDRLKATLNRFPGNGAVLLAQAILALKVQDVRLASKSISALLKADPVDPLHNVLAGDLAISEKRMAEAEEFYGKALGADAKNIEALRGMAGLCVQQRRHSLLLDYTLRLLEVSPQDVTASVYKAVALSELKRHEEALAAIGCAIKLDSENGENWAHKSTIERAAQLHGESFLSAQKAVALSPDKPLVHSLAAGAHQLMGDHEAAIEHHEKALSLQAANPGFFSAYLMSMCYTPVRSDRFMAAQYRRFAACLDVHCRGERKTPSALAAVPMKPVGPLRIGFVSGDFRQHSCANFLLPLYEQLKEGPHKILSFPSVGLRDDVTDRFQDLSAEWHDISALGFNASIEVMRSASADILIDTSGHTSGMRLGEFNERCAPVQVTWLGYPHGTGVPAMDWRISDIYADPPLKTDDDYLERLFRMDRPFLGYRHVKVRELDVSPLDSDLPIVFGSFNNPMKITPAVCRVWARILDRVPQSWLLLKSGPFRDALVVDRYMKVFEMAGIDRRRIQIFGGVAEYGDHLTAYRELDIALDPFPYSGTTSSCEALSTGIPIITLEGEAHVARVTAALLKWLGRPEWVAQSEDEYVEIAVQLARNVRALRRQRPELHEAFEASPICDVKDFTAHFTRSLSHIWRDYCERSCAQTRLRAS